MHATRSVANAGCMCCGNGTDGKLGRAKSPPKEIWVGELIIVLLHFRELRSKLPTKILLNYCIALSLTLIVFLATPEGSKSSSLARCRTAAVALHYFLLAAFLWMAVEAFSLYLAIIKSRKIDLYPCVFLLKCCLFAWGKTQNFGYMHVFVNWTKQ
jgi:hypothetical protein